uniref:DUF4408 domain-containing protein n=1 Tax=Leersia perrieri TaxID=77586 RepID=A0A0D9WRC1_9ORYZ
MLEAVIPAVWSAVHGWFTPAVLFVVLNIVIGTIAVTSKVASATAAAGGEGEGSGGDWARGGSGGGGGGGGGERRGLSRVPSMALDRIRSFNLSSRFVASAPEPTVDGVVDLGIHGEAEAVAEVEMEAAVKEVVGEIEREEHAHIERSRSEAAEADVPRLPLRLRKSASDRSAFAHFEAEKAAAAAAEKEEETVAAVEARRPATTREAPRVWADDDGGGSETESGDEAEDAAGEVDARADDFINKFRHQLKLQRIDSYLRHRDMLRRSHAAAAVGSD